MEGTTQAFQTRSVFPAIERVLEWRKSRNIDGGTVRKAGRAGAYGSKQRRDFGECGNRIGIEDITVPTNQEGHGACVPRIVASYAPTSSCQIHSGEASSIKTHGSSPLVFQSKKLPLNEQEKISTGVEAPNSKEDGDDSQPARKAFF